ncbi:hypothetical protein J6836_03205 [Providencia sp. R33]|uniref:hypothetical protein n=1 Tax=Providencia sp. R33 TaxID=2828763 RepID=UPI001C5AAD6A|nr:hypothetical protein J6836_03205 [Providencia sp. R33]
MLECLALEDSCIGDVWNLIYESWSWGGAIAVISLIFTARALKKTDKANKIASNSLELTKRSTDIASKSLQAAKQSIDTSIELYEKQKKDDEDNRKKQTENLNKAVMVTAGKEAYMLLQLFNFFIDLNKMLSSDIVEIDTELSSELLWKNIYFLKADGTPIPSDRVPEIPKYFSHEVLINSAMSSMDIFFNLSNLNAQILAMDTLFNVTLSDFKKNDILNAKDTIETLVLENKESIKRIASDIFVFDTYMVPYGGYNKAKDKITEHIQSL